MTRQEFNTTYKYNPPSVSCYDCQHKQSDSTKYFTICRKMIERGMTEEEAAVDEYDGLCDLFKE